MTRTLAPFLILLAAASNAFAADQTSPLRLAHVFTDHGVLQRDLPLPVWGWAAPGASVAVTLASQSRTATAGVDGRWTVTFDALKSGGAAVELQAISGKASASASDLLVGEVWLCSGQSNMQYSTKASNNAKAELAAAELPRIRLLDVPENAIAAPVADISAGWTVCSPKTVHGFSAVGYFFGRELSATLDVPVGLISAAVGGTRVQSWISREAFAAEPSLIDIAKAVDTALAKAGSPTAQVKSFVPSCLRNGMITPLLPFAIRGVIWYQGESNVDDAWRYRTLFPTMIRDWRTAWGQGDFPFLFVQLANFQDPPGKPSESDWAELRDAQFNTLRTLPATGMALAIDIGDADNLHPRNKQEVGRRLVRWALSGTYGRQVEASGPLYLSAKVEQGRIRVAFDHLGGGLVAKDGPLVRFAIADEDRKWTWADAVIDGDTVVVSSATVAKPVAVRYAWAANPSGCNLYNKAGLPASPFRTDDWPAVTYKN